MLGVQVRMIDEDGGGTIDLQEFIDAVREYGKKGQELSSRKKASCDIGAESDGNSPLQDAVEAGHIPVSTNMQQDATLTLCRWCTGWWITWVPISLGAPLTALLCSTQHVRQGH